MSTSLVRKGLELFADESVAELGRSSGSLSQRKKKGPASMRREDMMKGINTNKRGVRKQLNKIKHKEIRKPTAKEGKIKSSIDSYKKSQPSDSTEDNVKLLLGLSRSNPDTSGFYTQILKHSRGKLAKDREAEEEQPEKESGFSEEDFELFAKEYMPKKRDAVL